MCPRCRGLLVLGDEYSIIIVRPVGSASPNDASAAISPKRSIQKAGERLRLRNPLMTLKAAICGLSATMRAPISLAVTSGDLWLSFSNGNVTSV